MTEADGEGVASDEGGRAPVEVWLARLDAGSGRTAGEDRRARTVADAASPLTPAERDRAGRFRFDDDRERWERARSATREILSARTGVPAREVAWREGPHGKPELAGSARLHFNLSHSGPLLAVALSTAGAVGVDLEIVAPLPDMERVAARVFSEEEWEPAETLGEAERVRYFYRLWTLKEAVLKYLGTGLSLSPTAVALHPMAEGPPFVRGVEADGWPGDAARARSFDPGSVLAGAPEDARASLPDALATPPEARTTVPDAIGAVVWSGGAGEPVLRRWPNEGRPDG